MPTVPQEYRQARLEDLQYHPENPRQGDVGAIHTSIDRNGFYGAVIVQKSSGYVIAGNHRLMAMAHAGEETIPIIEVDVDDRTARRIMLADNRTNDLATYNNQLLTELLSQLANEDDLLGTGYDGDDLDALLKEWQSDMQGHVSSDPPTTQGRLIVTFDEKDRDDVRSVLVAAISASDLVGVEVS